ncbi:MAG: saccharopine dehydrogenase C-terminal domain-containing protein [Pseudomonadota bacterium]
MKNILVLGSGLVARPLASYLLNHQDYKVTIASKEVEKAQKLIDNHQNGNFVKLNVDMKEKLQELVKNHDIIVSLLPSYYHPQVAKICIEEKKNMVTTSYVSDEMQSFDKKATEAGVLILNEMGVDPGIDHMSAIRIIDAVRAKGGKITSFKSYCGGLPAPKNNDNPFGYKFSWSPKGVLLAGRSHGKYLENGQEIFVDKDDLFSHYNQITIGEVGTLEAYPNRDSIPYIKAYGFDKIHTMLRGTLRNIGWCQTMKALTDLKYLNEDKLDQLEGKTYAHLTSRLCGGKIESVKEDCAKYLNLDVSDKIINTLEWLGLFSNKALPDKQDNCIDLLTSIMLEKMSYKDKEQDMIVLFHDFLAEYPDGKKEKITSTLIDYGIEGGDSSMSRTVSLPAAIATKLILSGEIQNHGVYIPNIPEIYNPVLDELEKMNIKCTEETKIV